MENHVGISGSQPLKWHGGKFYLAKRILPLIPEHIHYVEPFFGGGSVLFSKPSEMILNHSEVINDLNLELTNFWAVLKDTDQFAKFVRIVTATPFSTEAWNEALANESVCPVDRAVAFFVRYRQSRQGLGSVFATMSRTRTRRGMNEQVSSWLSAIEGLPEVHARLQRVVIFNESATRVIKHQDGLHSFFYLDPPYLHETRSSTSCYEFEMSVEEHQELLDVLEKVSGKFLLSGYPSKLYDEYATRNGWNRIDVQIDNKASSLKEKPMKTECFWMNY